MVRGLIAAAELAEAHAATAEHAAGHHERQNGDSPRETQEHRRRADVERISGAALRAFATLLRSRANAETTDQIPICAACRARAGEAQAAEGDGGAAGGSPGRDTNNPAG